MSVPPVYERHATVTRVVDGDTLHLQVDLGCDITIAIRSIREGHLGRPRIDAPIERLDISDDCLF